MSVAFLGGEGGTRIKLLLRKILLIYSALARLTINSLFQNPPVASFTLVNLSGGKTIHRIVFTAFVFSKGSRPLCIKKHRRTLSDGVFWRRRRDSNPRASFEPAYALSRGASSPLEYFSKCNVLVFILS